MSVIFKMVSHKEKLKFNRDCTFHTQSCKHLNNVETAIYKYPIKHTGAGEPLWSSKPHSVQNEKKIIVSRSGYLNAIYDDGKLGVSQDAFYIKVSSQKESTYIIKLIDSKLYRWFLNINKWSGFNHPGVFGQLPYPKGLPDNFTDTDLYNYFNLTADEIALVEETIK